MQVRTGAVREIYGENREREREIGCICAYVCVCVWCWGRAGEEQMKMEAAAMKRGE